MQIEIKKEITGRFVVITVEEDACEDFFGTELLQYNNIKGIMGGQVRKVDDEIQYVYDVQNG